MEWGAKEVDGDAALRRDMHELAVQLHSSAGGSGPEKLFNGKMYVRRGGSASCRSTAPSTRVGLWVYRREQLQATGYRLQTTDVHKK